MSRRLLAFLVVVAALVAVAAAVLVAGGGKSTPALVLDHNGGLADYAFDQSAPTSSLAPAFRPGGTAPVQHESVHLGSSGLYVSVGKHKSGTWRGFYEATAAVYPANSVIHVRMWRPQRKVLGTTQSGISLLAVQTGASKLLDYVLVAGVVAHGQDTWFVGYAKGGTLYSTTKVLSYVPSTATSEDVTLRTNGGSKLSVYFGDKRVYESASLKLGVTPPLRVYLEVEARGMSYLARFQDFWVAAGTSMRIDGLRAGDHVSLIRKGDATVEAVASKKGQARLQLPLIDAVGKGTLTIDGPHLRRRFKDVAIAGGDVYNFTS